MGRIAVVPRRTATDPLSDGNIHKSPKCGPPLSNRTMDRALPTILWITHGQPPYHSVIHAAETHQSEEDTFSKHQTIPNGPIAFALHGRSAEATLFGSRRSEQGISTCQCPTVIQAKRRQDGGVHTVASLSHKSHTSRLSLSATKFNLSNPPVSQRPTATVSRG